MAELFAYLDGFGAGGSLTKSILIVTAPTGSTVTVTKGATTKTATEKNGEWWFKNLENGEWTIRAELDGQSAEEIFNITQFGVYRKRMAYARIFGISRDITATSPAWARTDMAIGMTAKASVGTVAGKSDFDNEMPWKGIVRQHIGSDVMVKIPKFYYQRTRSGTIEHIRITDKPESGFKVHPLFTHNGKESAYAYVGAYKTSSNNRSVSGAKPQLDQTRATMRNNAKGKGTGWSLIDIAALSAIQMLMLVEYADNDMQKVIGRGNCDNNDIASILRTGSCDNVPGLTGRPAGTDGKVDVIYRGIEGVWGNIWEWVDGVNVNNGTFYVCNDQSKYADNTSTGYTPLSFKAPTISNSFITGVGLDIGANTHVMLPDAVSGGSETTYFCDRSFGNPSTGWRVVNFSGCMYSEGSAGLFCVGFNNDSSHHAMNFGSRLLYIPS